MPSNETKAAQQYDLLMTELNDHDEVMKILIKDFGPLIVANMSDHSSGDDE